MFILLRMSKCLLFVLVGGELYCVYYILSGSIYYMIVLNIDFMVDFLIIYCFICYVRYYIFKKKNRSLKKLIFVLKFICFLYCFFMVDLIRL